MRTENYLINKWDTKHLKINNIIVEINNNQLQKIWTNVSSTEITDAEGHNLYCLHFFKTLGILNNSLFTYTD
jgi:hypothetical protein